jgi:hypothetical protein
MMQADEGVEGPRRKRSEAKLSAGDSRLSPSEGSRSDLLLQVRRLPNHWMRLSTIPHPNGPFCYDGRTDTLQRGKTTC